MNMPLVLAGPILRRVEPRSVSVWVALSARRVMGLRVWQGLQTGCTTGLLTTRLPDGSPRLSQLLLLSAEGFAPLQLGFGFTLTGFGGLLGNRTVAVDVLRGGLKTGILGALLFPEDPVRNAPQIVSDLRAVFPPGARSLRVWPPGAARLGHANALDPRAGRRAGPVRSRAPGRPGPLAGSVPEAAHALVQVRMDAMGLIEFNRGDVALEATLYDSRIVQFALTGDMGLRANWGAQPTFVLALGGCHPRFPAPAGFPQLARLALSLADGEALQLRCEAYLVLASNTVQFGARLDLHAAGGGFSFEGSWALMPWCTWRPWPLWWTSGRLWPCAIAATCCWGSSSAGRSPGPRRGRCRGRQRSRSCSSRCRYILSIGLEWMSRRRCPPPWMSSRC